MISFVFPLYNEASNLGSLYERVIHSIEELEENDPEVSASDFELIFVDDGSTDGSADVLSELAAADPRVQIIRFPRNFGSHAAIAAGLANCRGKACILLSSDLQDPPELLPALLTEWQKGYKVVWGHRNNRPAESPMLRFCSKLYYRILAVSTGIKLPDTGVDVALLDRAVIDVLNQCAEKNSSYVYLVTWLGFPAAFVPFNKADRVFGTSKWNFGKRVKLLVDSVVSFSYLPLRLMSLFGIVASLLGAVYAAVVTINAMFGQPIQGWSSLMIVVLLIGGFQMLMFGVLGEYLWRTYAEARQRPSFVIEKNTLQELRTAQRLPADSGAVSEQASATQAITLS